MCENGRNQSVVWFEVTMGSLVAGRENPVDAFDLLRCIGIVRPFFAMTNTFSPSEIFGDPPD